MPHNPYQPPVAPDRLPIAGHLPPSVTQQAVPGMLTCPNCQQPTISIRRAAIVYPVKIRCPACRNKIRIVLRGSDKVRYCLLWGAAVASGWAAIGALSIFQPYEIFRVLMETHFADLWNSVDAKFGRAGQAVVAGIAICLLAVAPVLLTSFIAFHKTVQLIKTNAVLLPTSADGGPVTSITKDRDVERTPP